MSNWHDYGDNFRNRGWQGGSWESRRYDDKRWQQPAGNSNAQSSWSNREWEDTTAVADSSMVGVNENLAENLGATQGPFVANSIPNTRDNLGRTIYDMEYFLALRNWTDSYKQHSVALKYFRDKAEALGVLELVMSNVGASLVPQFVKEANEGYHFEGPEQKPWMWQELVGQLDRLSLELVVGGFEAHEMQRDGHGDSSIRSRGLTACKLVRTDEYCHKRHAAAKKAAKKAGTAVTEDRLGLWDWMLENAEGRQIYLHPSYGSTKIECKLNTPREDGEIPTTGRGGSDGAGTFKHYKTKNVDATLKFDGTKKPGPGSWSWPQPLNAPPPLKAAPQSQNAPSPPLKAPPQSRNTPHAQQAAAPIPNHDAASSSNDVLQQPPPQGFVSSIFSCAPNARPIPPGFPPPPRRQVPPLTPAPPQAALVDSSLPPLIPDGNALMDMNFAPPSGHNGTDYMAMD